MVSDEEQEMRLAKRILRYLRDGYNQDVKRPVLVNSIAGNIGEDTTQVENYLEKMGEKGFVSCFKDLGGHPQCRILSSGIEHLEKLENKQSPEQTSSLKTDVNYMIEKFNQCKKDLEKLRNDDNSEIIKILTQYQNKPDETQLLEISKRMRNLLKIGFVDGEERSVAFTKEGSNFYTRIQSGDYFGISKSERQRRLYFQHIRWHEIKINEFLDELKLIQDVNQITREKMESTNETLKINVEEQIKQDLRFYISKINEAKSSYDYHKGLDVILDLTEYLRKLSLPEMTLHQLQSKINQINRCHTGWISMDWLKNGEEEWEPITKAYYDMISFLDFLMDNPTPLKFKTYKKIIEREKSKTGLIHNVSSYFKKLKNEKIYDKATQYDLYKDLKNIVKNATKEVFIIDPWMDDTIFELYVDAIPEDVQIKILTKIYKPKFLTVSKLFSQKHPIKIKTSELTHDRFLFVDDRCLMLGSSIKDAGKNKPTVIVDISSKNELYKVWHKYFEDGKTIL